MRDRRDALILEYLRTVRDIAKAEMVAKGVRLQPLSVYSSSVYPLTFQFKEKMEKGGGVIYDYKREKMPQWKDLTECAKIEIFQLFCEEWKDCLYTFNPKIHPDLISELSGKDLVSGLRSRAKRRLDRLGELPMHYCFVVEGHDAKGALVGLHLHGMAMVEDRTQAEQVKLAMGRAAGQEVRGRGKLPSGNLGRFYYYKEGKSWAGYITKSMGRRHPKIGRRSLVFSRPAVQLTREFYEYITGQEEAMS